MTRPRFMRMCNKTYMKSFYSLRLKMRGPHLSYIIKYQTPKLNRSHDRLARPKRPIGSFCSVRKLWVIMVQSSQQPSWLSSVAKRGFRRLLGSRYSRCLWARVAHTSDARRPEIRKMAPMSNQDRQDWSMRIWKRYIRKLRLLGIC